MLKSKFWRMQLPARKRFFVATAALVLIGLLSFEGYQITADQPQLAAESEIEKLEPVDCGVVLTGSPGRIREAIEIMAQKKVKKLVISGVYREAQLADIFPTLPRYPGVNPADIVLEKKSESTYGNAVQSLAVVEDLKCQSILLITSQLHMHRAFKIFKTIYPETIPIKKYYVSHLKKEPSEVDLLIEAFKSVSYLVFGRVL